MATPTNDESNRDFYPENARELNFESARKTAEDNTALDVENQKKHAVVEDPSVQTVIPARDVSESANPEQVRLQDETTSDEESAAETPAETDTSDTETASK